MDITFKKGDIVACALTGDYGKPRPAVITQADLFNPTHASITICPITSHLIDTPLFRLKLTPTKQNGLQQASQIMVDKITSVRRDKIHKVIGELTAEQQAHLNEAIQLWLGLT